MYNRLILLALISLCAACAKEPEVVQSSSNPFPNLKNHLIQKNDGQTTQQISYDSALGQLVKGPCDLKHGAQDGDDEMEGVSTQVLTARLDKASKTQFVVCFNSGASNDPAFFIVDGSSKKAIGVINTDHLFWPGNGFVYAVGRTNKLHTDYRKFAVRQSRLVEVKQPFLYVGLESTVNVPISLMNTKGGNDVVASIPKGEKVTVLIGDGEWVLVKTTFGLLGWFKPNGSREAPELQGVYFDGD